MGGNKCLHACIARARARGEEEKMAGGKEESALVNQYINTTDNMVHV